MFFAISSSHIALYQVSVRWVRCLPLTSFRFHLAMDTLVSLAGRFPLPGLVRDLHPLDDTHAGQTKRASSNLLLKALVKMAATYSPTGVQYHRRDYA